MTDETCKRIVHLATRLAEEGGGLRVHGDRHGITFTAYVYEDDVRHNESVFVSKYEDAKELCVSEWLKSATKLLEIGYP